MVTEKILDGKTLYLCDICGFGYIDAETARDCENWCRKTGTCSLEITKKAVLIPDPLEKLFRKTGKKNKN